MGSHQSAMCHIACANTSRSLVRTMLRATAEAWPDSHIRANDITYFEVAVKQHSEQA